MGDRLLRQVVIPGLALGTGCCVVFPWWDADCGTCWAVDKLVCEIYFPNCGPLGHAALPVGVAGISCPNIYHVLLGLYAIACGQNGLG